MEELPLGLEMVALADSEMAPPKAGRQGRWKQSKARPVPRRHFFLPL